MPGSFLLKVQYTLLTYLVVLVTVMVSKVYGSVGSLHSLSPVGLGRVLKSGLASSVSGCNSYYFLLLQRRDLSLGDASMSC